MKKIIGLSVVILMLTLNMNAQGKRDGQRKGNNYTPEQIATLHAKKMTLRLDLTQNQQTEVYNLMKESATSRNEMRTKMKENKEAGIKLTSDQKFELESKKIDKQIAHKAALKNILNKDQFEKWSEMMQKKMRNGKMAHNGKGNKQKKGAQKNGNSYKDKS